LELAHCAPKQQLRLCGATQTAARARATLGCA